MPTDRWMELGIKVNARPFCLLILINAFVGATVGLERAVLPLIAKSSFGLVSKSVTLSFLISFGLTKASANLFAGHVSERIGRKRMLIAGWLAGLPVPFLIMFAPSWGWVVFANVLLGINQGLCWSTTLIMMIDMAGPKRRGLAIGVNEFIGYAGVSLSALLTGYLATAYGLRPAPFYPGIAFTIAGLLLSFFAQDTRAHARGEAGATSGLPFMQIVLLTLWKQPTMFSASQAGMMNKINDGVVWGLLPIFWSAAGMSVSNIGVVAATYPAVWGVSLLATGALSDRWGRKWMIAAGMWVQAAGIGVFLLPPGVTVAVIGAAILGVGTALVYPTLLATISDAAKPAWRASALGVYRMWRDGGYAVSALLAGILADSMGIPIAIAAVAALTLCSGVVVAVMMNETAAS
jgi:MFS family permease